MSRENSFIYRGKYYEYCDEELSAQIKYPDLPKELLNLFGRRTRCIKNMPLKDMEGSILFDHYWKDLKDTEKSIDKVLTEKKMELNWYHPSIGIDVTLIEPLENQEVLICPGCKKKLPINYKWEDMSKFRTCPDCGKLMNVKNQYIYASDKHRKKYNKLSNNEKRNIGISLLTKEINELKKVNTYSKTWYYQAQLDLLKAYQNCFLIYLEKSNIEQASKYIDLSINQIIALEKAGEAYWYMYTDFVICLLNKMRVEVRLSDRLNVVLALRERINMYLDGLLFVEEYLDGSNENLSRQECLEYLRAIDDVHLTIYPFIVCSYAENDQYEKALETMREWYQDMDSCKYTTDDQIKKSYYKFKRMAGMFPELGLNA